MNSRAPWRGGKFMVPFCWSSIYGTEERRRRIYYAEALDHGWAGTAASAEPAFYSRASAIAVSGDDHAVIDILKDLQSDLVR
jgi:hypothetical protein